MLCMVMKMNTTKNSLKDMQFLGWSYFSGKPYYKNVRTGIITPETYAIYEELSKIV